MFYLFCYDLSMLTYSISVLFFYMLVHVNWSIFYLDFMNIKIVSFCLYFIFTAFTIIIIMLILVTWSHRHLTISAFLVI